jgi:hypothetical protein
VAEQTAYQRALDNLGQAIAQVAQEIAPRLDTDGDYDREHGTVPPNMQLTEWALVSNWVDLDTGRTFFELDFPDAMLKSHVVGLLTVALDYSRH